MQYFLAIAGALGSAIFHGGANILDSYFSNSIFKRLATIIFIWSLLNIAFLPIVFILDFPSIISLKLLPIIIAIAATEVLYQFPYYWALRTTDTSVAASLFSFGDLFVPLFAFFIVGEQLAGLQYIGFFMVIIASITLSLDFKKFKVNTALFLMVGVSLLLALQTVLYKYLFEQGTRWGTATTWVAIVQIVIASSLLLYKKNRQDFPNIVTIIKKSGWMLLLIQVLTWGGEAAGNLSLLIIPASVMHGITATQPIFVLIFAIIFAKRLPVLFREETDRKSITKKLLLFAVMIAGIVLVMI